MKITKQEVEHVAKLARLELSEQEKEKLTDQLSNILTYVEKMSELDTKGVEPTSHVLATGWAAVPVTTTGISVRLISAASPSPSHSIARSSIRFPARNMTYPSNV